MITLEYHAIDLTTMLFFEYHAIVFSKNQFALLGTELVLYFQPFQVQVMVGHLRNIQSQLLVPSFLPWGPLLTILFHFILDHLII